MNIIVTSKNPVKLQATKYGFKACFPDQLVDFTAISIPSGVSDQPLTEKETLRGARQRVEAAKALHPTADYWVGIEGGLEAKGEEMEAFAWVYILSNQGIVGKGRTGTFFLPKQMITVIHEGKELGEADDIVFKQINSKQKDGTVGALTKNLITRTTYYQPAVIFALIPFMNPTFY